MNEKHNLLFIYFNQVCMVCFPGLVHESRLTVYYFIFSKTRGKAPAGVYFLGLCYRGPSPYLQQSVSQKTTFWFCILFCICLQYRFSGFSCARAVGQSLSVRVPKARSVRPFRTHSGTAPKSNDIFFNIFFKKFSFIFSLQLQQLIGIGSQKQCQPTQK